jgi:hypothetical protein
MADMVATIVMSGSSALLFGYWFRYVCLLVLATQTAQDYSAEVAKANRLCFLQVRSKLHERERTRRNLDPLYSCLERDYVIIISLLKHTGLTPGEAPVERLSLTLDYCIMKMWYRFSRRFSVEAASHALEEMSRIVGYFANSLGERVAAGS